MHVAARLRGALNDQTFLTWFSDVGPVAVDGDEGEVAGVGVSPETGDEVLRFNPHSNLHRCPPHKVDARLHDHQIAHVDRLAEVDAIDGRGDARGAGVTSRAAAA